MKKDIFIILSLILLPYRIYAQKIMTLDDCIQYAIEHNVTLKQRNVSIDISKQNLYESKNAYLPEVHAEASEQIGYGNLNTAGGTMPTSEVGKYGFSYSVASLKSSMPLYAGGAIKNQKEADFFSLEEAVQNFEAARKDISIQVAVQYLQVLYYKSLTEISRRQCELSRQMYERAQMRVDEGKAPESEKANSASRLASDEYQLSQNEGSATIATVNLIQLLNMDSPDGIDFDDPSLESELLLSSISALPETAASLYENSVESFPTVLAAKAAIKASEKKVLVAKGKLRPSLDLRINLSSTYYYVFDDDIPVPSFGEQVFTKNPAEIVGIHANIPIFNRFAYKSEVKRAEMNVSMSQLNLERSRQNLRNDIQQAYYNAQTAVTRFVAASKAKDASFVSYSYEKEKYESGRSTIFDYFDANQQWIKAQQEELQSRYEYLIRKRILDFYTK